MVVVLFVFGLVVLVTQKLLTATNDQIQGANILEPERETELQDTVNRFPAVFDVAFLVLFVVLFIAILVSAAMLPSQPAYFFVTCFVMLITVLIAAALGNGFYDATTQNLATERALYPFMQFMMDHLVMLIAGVCISMMIALYATRGD